jgi:anti-sigma factor RsiW
MTERDLSEEWARTQLEAWVDGSLTGDNRERMAAALAADPRLRAAAERALAVRRALRASPPAPSPAALRRRLLAIPGRSGWPAFALPTAATAALAVVAAAIWLRPAPPPPAADQRVVAVQEFELAMHYLQKSARMTQGEVTSAVGASLRDALAASREALARETEETGG